MFSDAWQSAGCRLEICCDRHGSQQLCSASDVLSVSKDASQILVCTGQELVLHFVASDLAIKLMALGWLWWRAWFPVTPLDFAWQAWHFATSTFTLRGTRGTW